jgi:hypothetical protein
VEVNKFMRKYLKIMKINLVNQKVELEEAAILEIQQTFQKVSEKRQMLSNQSDSPNK